MRDLLAPKLLSRLREDNCTMYGNHERTVPMFIFTEKARYGGSADPVIVGKLLEQGLLARVAATTEGGRSMYQYFLK